jgi:polyphosphate glucokinase
MTLAVGVDVGGTGIKGGSVDVAAGKLIGERVRMATPSPSTPRKIVEAVVRVLESVDADGTVGLTLPAVITAGVARTAANIDKRWIGTDAAALFRDRTGRDVRVLNDADAAGMAEMRYGAGLGRTGVVIMVTLGTGIGSAVFAGGVLVPNTELGHLRLHRGEAEDWAAESVRDREDLSWKAYAERLQDYLRVLHQLLWPELIIIGGGISKKADRFLPLIKVDTAVVAASMQNDAGIIGAALFASSPPTVPSAPTVQGP